MIQMILSKETRKRKSYYYCLLVLVLAGLGTLAFFHGFAFVKGREIANLQLTIEDKKQQITTLYTTEGLKEYLTIKSLESQKEQIPWSSYIEKILEILEEVKGVAEGKRNVHFSDFQVSLDELSLKGVVSNLRVLYYSYVHKDPSKSRLSLLDHLKSLEFLKNITIREYEKEEENGYTFTLHANIINHANTGSTAHQ